MNIENEVKKILRNKNDSDTIVKEIRKFTNFKEKNIREVLKYKNNSNISKIYLFLICLEREHSKINIKLVLKNR